MKDLFLSLVIWICGSTFVVVLVFYVTNLLPKRTDIWPYNMSEYRTVTTNISGSPELHSPKHQEESYLLVLFTTFINNTQRSFVQNNTVLNWAQFAPLVKPVLFSTECLDTNDYKELALEQGWDMYQISHTNLQGTPTLKHMYYKVTQQYNSTFYAFSNGDILYTHALVNTLKYLKTQLKDLSRVLIVGQRINHYDANSTEPLYRSEDVNATAGSYNFTRYMAYAEDFFIVSHDGFPWDKTPDLVIGRLAYDNYLVAFAGMEDISVVDISMTVVALHQNIHEHPGDGRKQPDAKHNDIFIRNSTLHHRSFPYSLGTTKHAQYYTVYDQNRNIVLKKRSRPVKKIKIYT